MKIQYVSLLFLAFGCLMSCDKDDSTKPKNGIEGTWNITKISGGFAGLQCTYDFGEITWVIDATKITRTNNLTESTLCASTMPSLEHSYSIEESGGDTFLFVNGGENGRIIITDQKLTIDQNIQTSGTGNDGFRFELEK